MGGYGTRRLAAAHPRAFAAIAPVCGGLKGGSYSPERLVAAVRDAGGSVRFTVYLEAGHDSWTQTYDNPELYEWMLAQRNERFRL